MNIIEEISQKLENMSNTLRDRGVYDQTLTTHFGWNVPSVTSEDLINIPLEINEKIKSYPDLYEDDEFLTVLAKISSKLTAIQENLINNGHFYNGSYIVQAVISYLETFNLISNQLEAFFNWQVLENPKSMPANIAKRIRRINTEVDQLVPDQESLKNKILEIEKAHEAAENLPVDLMSLSDLKTKLVATNEDATLKKTKIQGLLDSSNIAHEKLKTIEVEAAKILAGCEDAYRASTSRGLAIAFDQRALKLKQSIWLWTGLLILSLIAISTVGYIRAEQLNGILNSAEPINWGLIILSIVFSILGVVAPGWLAWLATKQISQRFRLSEDYEFKASVAKAYEGYRSEAAKMDIKFTSRLFDSALTRLDEHPLRLIEEDYHGSPLHELLNSAAFKKAADIVPELKDKALEIAKSAADKIPNIDSKVDNI